MAQKDILKELVTDLAGHGVRYYQDRGWLRLPFTPRRLPLSPEEAQRLLEDGGRLVACRQGTRKTMTTPAALETLACAWGSESLGRVYGSGDSTPLARAIRNLSRAGWRFADDWKAIGPAETYRHLGQGQPSCEKLWALSPKDENWAYRVEVPQRLQALDYYHGSHDARSLLDPELAEHLERWYGLGAVTADGCWRNFEVYAHLAAGRSVSLTLPGDVVLARFRLERGADLGQLTRSLERRATFYREHLEADVQGWSPEERKQICDILDILLDAPVEGLEEKTRARLLLDLRQAFVSLGPDRWWRLPGGNGYDPREGPARSARTVYQQLVVDEQLRGPALTDALSVAAGVARAGETDVDSYLDFWLRGRPYHYDSSAQGRLHREAFLELLKAGFDPHSAREAPIIAFDDPAGGSLDERMALLLRLGRAVGKDPAHRGDLLTRSYNCLRNTEFPPELCREEGVRLYAELLGGLAGAGRAVEADVVFSRLMEGVRSGWVPANDLGKTVSRLVGWAQQGQVAGEAAAALFSPCADTEKATFKVSPPRGDRTGDKVAFAEATRLYDRLSVGLARLGKAAQTPEAYLTVIETIDRVGLSPDRALAAVLQGRFLDDDQPAGRRPRIRKEAGRLMVGDVELKVRPERSEPGERSTA
ncbi:MAG: hypothetical protein HY319_02705 [Armatimonadetes bacterium]|nr:hypothetical protein [Armatimonadota bacterium]